MTEIPSRMRSCSSSCSSQNQVAAENISSSRKSRKSADGTNVTRGCFGFCFLTSKSYNFEREVLSKYDVTVFEEFMNCFDCLPLAAVVTTGKSSLRNFFCDICEGMGRFFCVHGGLSPMIHFPSDVERLERFEEPPHWGPMVEIAC